MSQRKTLIISIILLLVILLTPLSMVDAADDEPYHAPYFINYWQEQGYFDVATVDWYCEIDAVGTYWAVQSWGYFHPMLGEIWTGGYAGFQNVGGTHKILMSGWDLPDGTEPSIEYVYGGHYGRFGNEGTGIQIYTEYPWKEKTWYTMRIQVRQGKKKTYIEQWVKEKGGDWLLTAIMSYPQKGMSLCSLGGFQEDFDFNNLQRKQRVKNIYGRNIYGQWFSFPYQDLANCYDTGAVDKSDPDNPIFMGDIDNVTFNCDWGLKKDYLWIETGGGDFTPNGKYLPAVYTLQQPPYPKVTEFLNYKDYKLKKTMNSVPEVNIDWEEFRRNQYDMFTLDFCNKTSVPGTKISLPAWEYGQTNVVTDEKGSAVEIELYRYVNRYDPEILWVNDRYDYDDTSRSAFKRIVIDYPLKDKRWYTFRMQCWNKKEQTIFGYWIKSKNGDWELLALLALPENDVKITKPFFKMTTQGNNLGVREFRLKNTYVHTTRKKKWLHWEHYQVSNKYRYIPDTIPGFSKTLRNTRNNIKSGRHKNGYVWVHVGGKNFKWHQRNYPFKFRIKHERDIPANPTFILTDIPKEYRP